MCRARKPPFGSDGARTGLTGTDACTVAVKSCDKWKVSANAEKNNFDLISFLKSCAEKYIRYLFKIVLTLRVL